MILFSHLEQEKANKEKTAKDKAYQEAIRAQQREEEFIGFRKLPARGTPQGNLVPFYWAVWPYITTDVINSLSDGPESEDDNNIGDDSIDGVSSQYFQ